MQTNLLQSKSNSAALYADVPIHQLLDVEFSKLNINELDQFITHLTQVQHAPAARRSVTKKESKALSKGQKHETVDDTFAHLL